MMHVVALLETRLYEDADKLLSSTVAASALSHVSRLYLQVRACVSRGRTGRRYAVLPVCACARETTRDCSWSTGGRQHEAHEHLSRLLRARYTRWQQVQPMPHLALQCSHCSRAR